MIEETIKTKKYYIEAFFDDFDEKIKKLEEILKIGLIEEALILACCYISALSSIRYKNSNSDRKKFIKIIFDYSDQKELFSKISLPYLFSHGKDVVGKDKENKPITKYNVIEATLKKIYKKELEKLEEPLGDWDCNIDINKNQLKILLKQQKISIDNQELEDNLDKITYVNYLYKFYRCVWVHEGSIVTQCNLFTKKPTFGKNSIGENVYYENSDLCISKDAILELLHNIYKNLRKECISTIKWPRELNSSC